MTRDDINTSVQLFAKRDALRHELTLLNTRAVVPSVRIGGGHSLYYLVEQVPTAVFDALAEDLRGRIEAIEGELADIGAEVAA